MLGEKFGHFCLNRLRQQGTRSIAQHLGERVAERPWLKQLDDVSIGHGVSLLCWRSGGSNTPTIRRLLPVRPSPTSAYSSFPLAGGASAPLLAGERRSAKEMGRGVGSRRGSPGPSFDETVCFGCAGPVCNGPVAPLTKMDGGGSALPPTKPTSKLS